MQKRDLWGDLAAVGAVTAMGLHVMRAYVGQLGFIVGAALTFTQTVGLLIAVWCLGILGWFVAPRLGGPRPALRLGSIFGAIYVASHGLALPGVTQVLAALAIMAWLWLLPALADALGRTGRAERIAPGILLGLAVQAGLLAATHGLDLPLWRGLGAGLTAAALAGALLGGLYMGSAAGGAPASGDTNTPGWGLLALAPYLVLQMTMLANAPQVAVSTGWSLTAAAGLVAAGPAAGCAALALRPGYGVRVVAALLAIGLLTWQRWSNGPSAWVLVPVQACLSLALPAALYPQRSRLRLVATVAALLFFGLYFLHHTGAGWASLYPVLGGLAVLPALLPLRVRQGDGARQALAALAVLGALGLGVGALPRSGARPEPGPAPAQLRVMTYNVHEGYSNLGIPDAELIARAIEAARPDLAGLQEISRGLDVMGGADLAAYLAWRLPEYHVVYGATNGDRQGNLLLSRYPIIAQGSLRFPRLVAGEQRGLTWVRIPAVAGDLTFAVTHFSAWADEGADRMAQAEGVLAFWRQRPRTLVAGDFNETPGGPAIERLRAGGLTDLAAAAGKGGEPTFPALRPSRRIDYIWASPDVLAVSAEVPAVTASDHRPVLAAVEIK